MYSNKDLKFIKNCNFVLTLCQRLIAKHFPIYSNPFNSDYSIFKREVGLYSREQMLTIYIVLRAIGLIFRNRATCQLRTSQVRSLALYEASNFV